jgi:hypothetical protein
LLGKPLPQLGDSIEMLRRGVAEYIFQHVVFIYRVNDLSAHDFDSPSSRKPRMRNKAALLTTSVQRRDFEMGSSDVQLERRVIGNIPDGIDVLLSRGQTRYSDTLHAPQDIEQYT